MPDLLLSSAEYSSYISIIKLVIFLILFFAWLPLLGWVYRDAKETASKETLWTGVLLVSGAIAAIIWLVVPVFIVGMLLYSVAVGLTAISYVKHRNTKVLEFDRVLTAEHIKGLLSAGEQKKLYALKNFLFVTANNNEIPMPQPRTPEFFGYRAAYDIFIDAIWRRASNIIFSPTHQNYNVTYHVDGAALKQPIIDRERMKHFIHFIKSLADLDINEKRKPQKGRFGIRQAKDSTQWEVTTAGSTAGEQVQVKRITQGEITKLSDIGLSQNQYELMNEIREAKEGVFVVSGPKRSGVTNTFYALLRNHDAFLNSINTLEKQVSTELPNITQNVFSLSDTGTTTYARRLQSVIRMGPDIVGVADCEDTETAQIVCAAAKDGKIMYVTLEADSVIRAFGKWVRLVGHRSLAIETLLGISNQRLLRKLCGQCKQAYAPNAELFRKFNIPAEKAKALYRAGKVQYDKHGKPVTCENCQGTGFVGRVGVFETIITDKQLRGDIKQAKSLSEIGTQFRRAKMLYLQEQALRKVIDGTTSINEMLRILSGSERRRRKSVDQRIQGSKNGGVTA